MQFREKITLKNFWGRGLCYAYGSDWSRSNTDLSLGLGGGIHRPEHYYILDYILAHIIRNLKGIRNAPITRVRQYGVLKTPKTFYAYGMMEKGGRGGNVGNRRAGRGGKIKRPQTKFVQGPEVPGDATGRLPRNV